MSDRLRVIVADDERPARSFLVALLRSFEDVAVVGEASSGRAAVTLINREKPDLALLDWQMPELDGIGVVRMLKKADMPLLDPARFVRLSPGTLAKLGRVRDGPHAHSSGC